MSLLFTLGSCNLRRHRAGMLRNNVRQAPDLGQFHEARRFLIDATGFAVRVHNFFLFSAGSVYFAYALTHDGFESTPNDAGFMIMIAFSVLLGTVNAVMQDLLI